MATYSRAKAIETFSWDSRIQRYVDIYNYLIREGNPMHETS